MSPSHTLQLFKNCSIVCPFHGYIPSGMACSSAGPPGGQKSCQKVCSSVGSSSWTTAPARTQFLHKLSMGCSFLQSMSTCCGMGSAICCSAGICSDIVLHGLQRDDLCHHGLLLGLQVNLCSWSTCSLFFLTDLHVCIVFSLTYSHSSPPAVVTQQFLPLICNPRGAISIAGRLSYAQQWDCLGDSWNWCYLTEANPVAPLLSKPCYITQYNFQKVLTRSLTEGY